MTTNYREQFLQANARSEYITAEVTEVIRNLLRAVAADDPSSATWKAAEQMDTVVELIKRYDQPLNFYGIMLAAVKDFQENLPEQEWDRDYVRAAQQGIKYLTEISATDNAARGRASKRLDEFRSAMEWTMPEGRKR